MSTQGVEKMDAQSGGGMCWHWIAPVLIVLAVILVYGRTLDIPFYLDDEFNLLTNPSVRDWRDWVSVLTPPAGTDDINLVRRPFINVTYAFNYALGGYHPAGYHLFNIAVHTLNGLLLYALLMRVLRGRGQNPALVRAAPVLAALTALLWVAHPLNTAAVNYVNQRTELLMTFFTLATLYSLHRSTDSKRPLAWKALAVGACGLGMACKEVMVVVPVLALAYDRIFLAGSWRELFRRRKGFYAALAFTWILLGVFLFRDAAGHGARTWGPQWWPYLMTQTWALDRYLKLAAWPHPLVFDYGDLLIRNPALVWSRALGILFLFGLSVVMLFKMPGIGFLGLAFFLVLAPSSSVNPVLGQTIAEHRMYLPLIPLILVVLLAGGWFTRARPPRQRLLAIALLLLVPVYGTAAWFRNQVYRDPLRLWTDTLEKWPGTFRGLNNQGVLLMDAGRLEESIEAFQEALKLNPPYPGTSYHLALAYHRLGRHEDAVAMYREALKHSPESAPILGNLARLLLALGRAEEARPLAQKALAARPGEYRLHLLAGDAWQAIGRTDEALAAYRRALEIKPQSEPVRLHQLAALLESERVKEAQAALQQILANTQPPGHPFSVAQKLAAMNRPKAALSLLAPHLESGMPLPPDLLNSAAWMLATAADDSVRDADLAIRLAERAARESRFSNPLILDTLAAAYAEAGRFDEATRQIEAARTLVEQHGPPSALEILADRAENYRQREPYRVSTTSGVIRSYEMIPYH